MEFQKLRLLLEGKIGISFIGYLENREHVIGNTVSISHGIFPYFCENRFFYIFSWSNHAFLYGCNSNYREKVLTLQSGTGH